MTIRKHFKSYISSFQVLENNNYDIILIESYPCETKDQLYSRERHYIETLDCVNLVIPGRNRKEYRNLPDRIEIRKQYLIDNKDKIKKTKINDYLEILLLVMNFFFK